MVRTLRPARILLAACWAGACSTTPPREASVPLEPAVVHYAPFVAAYEVVTHGRVDQEFNNQVATSRFSMRFHLSARVDSSHTGLRAAVTLDSVVTLHGAAIGYTVEEARPARGTTFRGDLAPTGEFRGIVGGDTTRPFVRQLLDRRIVEFFPRIPGDGARPGQRWVDTTESTTSSNGLDLTIRAVHNHEALGWRAHAGTTALHIRTHSTYSVAGRGLQDGQEIVLDGSGTRHAQAFLDGAGRYLGTTAHDTTNISAAVPAAGAVIPITQSQVDTIRVRS